MPFDSPSILPLGAVSLSLSSLYSLTALFLFLLQRKKEPLRSHSTLVSSFCFLVQIFFFLLSNLSLIISRKIIPCCLYTFVHYFGLTAAVGPIILELIRVYSLSKVFSLQETIHQISFAADVSTFAVSSFASTLVVSGTSLGDRIAPNPQSARRSLGQNAFQKFFLNPSLNLAPNLLMALTTKKQKQVTQPMTEQQYKEQTLSQYQRFKYYSSTSFLLKLLVGWTALHLVPWLFILFVNYDKLQWDRGCPAFTQSVDFGQIHLWNVVTFVPLILIDILTSGVIGIITIRNPMGQSHVQYGLVISSFSNCFFLLVFLVTVTLFQVDSYFPSIFFQLAPVWITNVCLIATPTVISIIYQSRRYRGVGLSRVTSEVEFQKKVSEYIGRTHRRGATAGLESMTGGNDSTLTMPTSSQTPMDDQSSFAFEFRDSVADLSEMSGSVMPDGFMDGSEPQEEQQQPTTSEATPSVVIQLDQLAPVTPRDITTSSSAESLIPTSQPQPQLPPKALDRRKSLSGFSLQAILNPSANNTLGSSTIKSRPFDPKQPSLVKIKQREKAAITYASEKAIKDILKRDPGRSSQLVELTNFDNLRFMLHSTKAIKYLKDFAKREWSTENIFFLEKVQFYKDLKTVKDWCSMAVKIRDTFLAPSSLMELNVDSETKADTIHKISIVLSKEKTLIDLEKEQARKRRQNKRVPLSSTYKSIHSEEEVIGALAGLGVVNSNVSTVAAVKKEESDVQFLMLHLFENMEVVVLRNVMDTFTRFIRSKEFLKMKKELK